MEFNTLISNHRTRIMGSAMIAIMLFHQPFFYSNLFVDFFHLYGAWGVEIFLFVSGFGIVYSLRKNRLKQYYINRFKRLFPPCIIIGICKYTLSLLGFQEFITSNIFLLITNIYLWYIYAIIIYYILAPWLYKFLTIYGKWGFFLICIFSLLCSYIPFKNSTYYLINHIGWLTARLPVFTLGIYSAIYPTKIKTEKIFIVGFFILIIYMLLKLASTMVRFQWKIPHLNLLILFATPMLCILSYHINNLADKIKCTTILEFFGTHSLELYLWHEFIWWNISRNELSVNLNPWLQCILALGLSIVLAHITYIIKNRISYFTK